MKKIILICLFLLSLGTLFAGCTLEKKEPDDTKGQSGAPNINYEIPDKVKDYGFDFQFVPDGE
jgi:hypothetical protein